MSDPGAAPASPADPSGARDLVPILRAVDLACTEDPPRFQLIELRIERPPTRLAVLDAVRVKAREHGRRVRLVRAADLSGDPLEWFSKAPLSPDEAVLWITGFQDALPVLRSALNVQRDTLVRRVPVLWLMVGDGHELAAIREEAPDWSDFALRLDIDVLLPRWEDAKWEGFWVSFLGLQADADSLFLAGSLGQAIEALRRAADVAVTVDERLGLLCGVADLVTLKSGGEREAIEIASGLAREAAQEGRWELWAAAQVVAADALLDVGRAAEARAITDEILGRIHLEDMPRAWLKVQQTRANAIGKCGEQQGAIRELSSALRAAHGQVPAEVHARALIALAKMHLEAGQADVAARILKGIGSAERRDLYEECLYLEIEIDLIGSNIKKSINKIHQLRKIRSDQSNVNRAVGLLNLGYMLEKHHQDRLARDLLAEALGLLRGTDLYYFTTNVAWILTKVGLRQKAYAQVVPWAQQGLEACESPDDARTKALLLINLATARAALGQRGTAVANLLEARAIAQDQHDDATLSTIDRRLAELGYTDP